MKKRFLLFLIFLIFVICSTTFVVILNYLDPFEYTKIALGSLVFSYLFGLSSLLCLILYIIKKIYFRGNITIYHVLVSFRQGFFISVFFLILVFFNYYGASIIFTSFLTFIVLFFLELFIKNGE
ncbi:hypothetical protein HUU51_02575 [Candidatus Gracilibacteria bacterium]|nr:hypothetical protein [Candidatus Gracilibacteria bacterium]